MRFDDTGEKRLEGDRRSKPVAFRLRGHGNQAANKRLALKNRHNRMLPGRPPRQEHRELHRLPGIQRACVPETLQLEIDRAVWMEPWQRRFSQRRLEEEQQPDDLGSWTHPGPPKQLTRLEHAYILLPHPERGNPIQVTRLRRKPRVSSRGGSTDCVLCEIGWGGKHQAVGCHLAGGPRWKRGDRCGVSYSLMSLARFCR